MREGDWLMWVLSLVALMTLRPLCSSSRLSRCCLFMSSALGSETT